MQQLLERVIFRLSKDDHKALKKIAKAEKVSVSKYLRGLVQDAVRTSY